MRLDKYLAETAQCTRSEAKALLAKGRVQVNGAVCKKGDTQLKETDTVAVDGKALNYRQFVYLMLNKPEGVVSASTDKRDTTVVDLPDGRAAFTPFAPGANPSYGAEQNGLLASLNSVAKLPYHWALDGISNTQTINPKALGHSEGERVENLVQVLDGYFDQGAHHLNVNVFGKEKLLDAMEHPEKEEYANFTIRVSGYAVKFIDLTREQQMDVISRTCHAAL